MHLSAAPFLPAVRYPAAPFARYTTLGDFNGDGRPDVAVVITGGDAVAILLNRGDGTFDKPEYLHVGFPRAVVAGDFNRDGHVDLAVTAFNGTNTVVDIFLGNGDGTFQTKPQHYPLFGGGQSIVAADFNGDGAPDLAVATVNRVAILLNRGDGTFAPAAYYNVGGGNPRNIAAGDFNGDGLPDLAVPNGRKGAVTILLNNKGAPGTFSALDVIPTGANPIGVAVADFNHDGNEDLAVVNSAFAEPAVTILLGNGDGTFRPRASYNGANFSDVIVAGDFNGDGNADLVVGSFTSSTRYMAGNGDGTFGPQLDVPGDVFSEFLQSADLNGDGRPDLVVTPAGGVRVSLNSGAASTPGPSGGSVDKTLSAGGARSFGFTSLDGTRAIISLSGPGTAMLHFSSSATIQVKSGRNLVSTEALQLASISGAGTTAATTLSISASGGSRTITLSDISTTGAFGSIAAPQANLTGTLSAPGGISRLSLLSANNGSIVLGGGARPEIQLGQTNNETITSAVPIGRMQVALDAGINLTVPSMDSLTVGRGLHDGLLTFTNPQTSGGLDLGMASIGSGISNVMIRSAGNIGVISAALMLNSSVYAGVGPLPPGQRLPAAASDFISPAVIRSLSLSSSGVFGNSAIAAYVLGTLRLGQIGAGDSIGAHRIESLSGIGKGHTKPSGQPTQISFRIINISSSGQVVSGLQRNGVLTSDFLVQVL